MKERKSCKKRYFSGIVAFVMVIVLCVSYLPLISVQKVEGKISEEQKNNGAIVFFDTASAQMTFNRAEEQKWDIYDDKIENVTDYNFLLKSSTDAKIVEDGVLQVDYDGRNNIPEIVSNSNYDGSYTIWGVGGNIVASCKNVKYSIKTLDPNVAQYMTVRFYQSGSNVLERKFDEWMKEAGITDTTIPADGEFHTYSLPVPSEVSGSLQGMKVSFERTDKSGTIYFGPVIYETTDNGEYILDDFKNGTDDRKNYMKDTIDGSLPLIRSSLYSEGITDGSTSGCNIRNVSDMLWTMSSSDANIVNNALSGNENALQIKYQNTAQHITYARLKADKQVSDETLMAITLKGADTSASDLSLDNRAQNVKVDDILYVSLYKEDTLVKKIPFTEFYESNKVEGKEHTDVSSSEYKTYYSPEVQGVNFDTVAFEFEGAADTSYSGRIFVQEIFFPRYSYTVNHYYDGTLQSDLTDTVNSAKYHDVISVTKKETDVYKYEKTETDTAVKSGNNYVISSDADNNAINVYYRSDIVPYTIEYYTREGDTDTIFETITGNDIAGTVVNYDTTKTPEGYKFDSTNITGNSMTLTTGQENILKVYYVKDNFAYTIEYYYDGVLDETKTETGTAEFGSTVPYTDKIEDGFIKIGTNPNEFIIDSDGTQNVFKIYYAKDSHKYTVEYYYDGKIDDTKTVNASAPIDTEIEYEDKNIPGYKLDEITPDGGKINISDNEENNVIKVYYVKDSFPYTIKYYYDDVLDDSQTETGTKTFEEEISYTDKAKEGYTFDYATPENGTITISENGNNNVIEVHYKKTEVDYTIHYYYDGELKETTTGSGFVGENIPYITTKDGFKFVKQEGNTVITASPDGNVVTVYFESEPGNTNVIPNESETTNTNNTNVVPEGETTNTNNTNVAPNEGETTNTNNTNVVPNESETTNTGNTKADTDENETKKNGNMDNSTSKTMPKEEKATSNIPQTGDYANPIVLVGSLVVLIMLLAVMIRKRKNMNLLDD